MRRTLLTLALLLLGAAPLRGQGAVACPSPADSSQVDRVVAVVGDSIVLFSDLVQECLFMNQRNQQAIAQNQQPVGFTVEDLLDNLVNVQVLLQHAARDSTVLPTSEELDSRVQAQIDSIRSGRFPSEAEFQRALAQQGLTLASYREQLRAQIRTSLIRDAYTRRLLQDAPTPVVSEAEMREFFQSLAERGELQTLPELLTVQQVLIRSGASDEAWARALQKADSLYGLIVRGADFATLAREHSQDSASAVAGGDLQWVARGVTVGEFERAAFALRDGGVSVPVRTEYGYHIITVERSRPGEKRVRHILIQPEVVPADLERARSRGQEVADRIRRGESALTLAQMYGDPSIPRELTQVPRGQEEAVMPPQLAQRLAGAGEGDVIGPYDVNFDGRDYVVVQHVTRVRAAGEFTFQDVRDRIRTLLLQQKRQERIYEDLREKTYVEIRYGT
jgi:peptidyl-prolyl cis-trans isomerase SurA